MNAKEILEKLKLTFNELVQTPEVPVALATAKLADGTEVEVTELAVGDRSVIFPISNLPKPSIPIIVEFPCARATAITSRRSIALWINGVSLFSKPASESW